MAAALVAGAGCRDDVGLGGGADLASLDLGVVVLDLRGEPDLSPARDLSQPDLAQPDLSTPDLAVAPDLAPPPCLDDRDCAGATPRCEVKSGACVACLPQNDNCTNGLHCLLRGGVYQCTTGCDVDGDCPGIPGATVACVMDMCVRKACLPGRLDCDGKAQNGCEVDGLIDSMNCGACGKLCAGANGAQSCKAGVCRIDRCDAGFANCDGKDETGCETDVRVDTKHCGACGVVCPALNGAAACKAGVCDIGPCTPGFANCDKQVQNGCEVNLQLDVKNCGACGNACMGPANVALSCGGGVCKVGGCLPGFADCDGNPMNGCEPRPCPSCLDGKLGGDESDVDCGGTLCDPCPGGKECKAGGDCQSGKCSPACCQIAFVCDQFGCMSVCVKPCNTCDP